MVDYTKRPDLKRLHVKPNPIKPEEEKKEEEKEEVKQEVKVEEVKEPINPMQDFFDDMGLIMYHARDPYLRKPSFDVGGPVIQNYLLWLQLAELMKMNRKLDNVIKEKLKENIE